MHEDAEQQFLEWLWLQLEDENAPDHVLDVYSTVLAKYLELLDKQY